MELSDSDILLNVLGGSKPALAWNRLDISSQFWTGAWLLVLSYAIVATLIILPRLRDVSVSG